MTTMPLAVPFLLTTVTFVPTARSATVLPCGRIFVSAEMATDWLEPSASLIVSELALEMVTLPTRCVARSPALQQPGAHAHDGR